MRWGWRWRLASVAEAAARGSVPPRAERVALEREVWEGEMEAWAASGEVAREAREEAAWGARERAGAWLALAAVMVADRGLAASQA